jgi:hypothetical protein
MICSKLLKIKQKGGGPEIPIFYVPTILRGLLGLKIEKNGKTYTTVIK